ncbi:hypothetical protein NDU88_002295 [Pleurodeles waltl]|uniref:Uncharacterized protein n=1 Tax=Pleurodeles waltl TaxID=8319 RepID=A0AAV7T1T9_PLEWA|nr:hypothetical protein NDU88_002295 [Pleurodeles waltl]
MSFKASQTQQRELEIKKLQRTVDKATDDCMKVGGQEAARCNLNQTKAKLKDFFLLEEVASSRAYQQQVYEESQQTGKYLAWTNRIKHERQTIHQIQDPKTSVFITHEKDIARVFMSHYSRIYETNYVVSPDQIDQYYKPIMLPKMPLNVLNDITQTMTPSEIKGAIQKMPSAKAYVGDGFPTEFYKIFCRGACTIPNGFM